MQKDDFVVSHFNANEKWTKSSTKLQELEKEILLLRIQLKKKEQEALDLGRQVQQQSQR